MIRKSIGRAFISLFYVVVLCAVIVVIAPWNMWVAAKIESQMVAMGLSSSSLSIAKLGLSHIDIIDFSAGDDLSAATIRAEYTPELLQHYRVQNIVINQAKFKMVQSKAGWSVSGYQPPSSGQAAFPQMPRDVQSMPFEMLSVLDSALHLRGVGWSGGIPFSVHISKGLMASVHAASFEYGAMKFSLANLETILKPDHNERWVGSWKVKDFNLPEIANFQGSGEIQIVSEQITISGNVSDDLNHITISFAFEYYFANPEAAKLTIKKATMPWGNGVISTSQAIVSLLAKDRIILPVYMNKVSVDEVMKVMAGKYVKATGTISGKVPVIIDRNGDISLGTGTLKADQDGSLSMPPDVIPGGGQQIEMTRDILKNFNYNQLQVDVSEEGADKIAVLLALKGNNPNVQNGRAVHLNVRLGGDVLAFIRSNVTMISQPETLFREGKK